MKMTLGKRRQTVARPSADTVERKQRRDNKQETDQRPEQEASDWEWEWACVRVRVGHLHAKPLLTRLLYLWP